MIEVAIMIEGQNGLNWKRWQRLASVVEACGYAGLYRSDHYTNSNPPDLDSLECWVSLTWLATHTKRIEFGPLVSPISFRHPTHTARMAAAIDDLSGGRLTLGIGAGWQEREHANYGWDLLNLKERFQRLEEGLEVITQLIKSDHPVDFSGHYYQIHEANFITPTTTRGWSTDPDRRKWKHSNLTPGGKICPGMECAADSANRNRSLKFNIGWIY